MKLAVRAVAGVVALATALSIAAPAASAGTRTSGAASVLVAATVPVSLPTPDADATSAAPLTGVRVEVPQVEVGTESIAGAVVQALLRFGRPIYDAAVHAVRHGWHAFQGWWKTVPGWIRVPVEWAAGGGAWDVFRALCEHLGIRW